MFNPADTLQEPLLWLQNTGIALAIREGDRLFPWIECVHVLAVTMVIGSIAFVDLRLVGLTGRDRSVADTASALLPVTWTAFAAAALSGALLFCSNAVSYAHNPFFQAKMALIAAAGVNMGLYQWTGFATTPSRARLVGAVSLGLWISVAACGRWIGFTLNPLA